MMRSTARAVACPLAFFLLYIIGAILPSCRPRPAGVPGAGNYPVHAAWFDAGKTGDVPFVVSVSPFDGRRDTLWVERPLQRLVCMSSSHAGMLEAIGVPEAVVGVSGLGYLSGPGVRTHAREVGYDAALDYETVLSLRPDVVLTYLVSSVEPPYISILKSLGIRVFTLYEHLEDHPLARSEYMRLLGVLTGREAVADSLFAAVCTAYGEIAGRHASDPSRPGVLLNVPYADQWFIPGAENYFSRLIADAGGRVVGAREGERTSRVVSLEEAYMLSREADFWLNTGWCRTREQLTALNPLFARFTIPHIYNNIKRVTPAGGNDFWESGAVRPDWILRDLEAILSGKAEADSLRYYLEVQ